MSGYSRISLLAVVCALACVNARAQYRDASSYREIFETGTSADFRKHIRALSAESLEGRAAGSAGEAEAAAYLAENLRACGVEILDLPNGNAFGVNEGTDTLRSCNVVGFIQGSDVNLMDRYIVIGARMDNKGADTYELDGRTVDRIYNGANGNASGMAMMLELARLLATNSVALGRSVLFVGFGASSHTYAGAWYFLNRAFGDVGNIDAMINLDCVGCGNNGFYAYTASNADMNTIIHSLEGELLPVRPELVSYEIYPSDHRAFYAKEIPSVSFSTGKYPEYGTERDTESIIDYPSMERELEYLYAFTVALARTRTAPLFHNKVQSGASLRMDSEVVPYYECDVPPMFLNSSDPRQFLKRWVYAYLKYPEAAVRNGIQGTVLVDFVIDNSGRVTDARVRRSVSEELDAEALKVISASPKWKPAKIKGRKVACSMTLPIEFRLEKSRKGSFGINNIIVK